MTGVLVIDKPAGPTSSGVVQDVRGRLSRFLGMPSRRLKVGHGGTLDPMASGVLPVCIGEATKLAPFLLSADKAYDAEIRFGVETDTLDAEGKILATHALAGLSAQAIADQLPKLRGEIQQVPPMYSALKHDGRPLYDYARAGVDLARSPRRVVIHEFEMVWFEAPDRAAFRVRCSKGTYVRVLAADLGRALGIGAHLAALRRTATGPFALVRSMTLARMDEFLEAGTPLPLVDLAGALAHMPAVVLSGEVAGRLARGQRVLAVDLAGSLTSVPAEPFRALRGNGTLLAVARTTPDGLVRTLRVFNA